MQYLVSAVPGGADVVPSSLAAYAGDAAAAMVRARSNFMGAMSGLPGDNGGVRILTDILTGRDSLRGGGLVVFAPAGADVEFAAGFVVEVAHRGHAGFGVSFADGPSTIR